MTRTRLHSVRLLTLTASLLGLAALTTACNVDISMRAEARDEWKRSYPLARGGAFRLNNTNGKMTVTAGDGDTIQVTAERIVRAGTDEAAKSALAALAIAETVAPDSVTLDSRSSTGGLSLNVNRQVNYTVQLPRWAQVTIDATNGAIEVRDVEGRLSITTTNGKVAATGLRGEVGVETTNGVVDLDLAAVTGDVRCQTTNGAVEVVVPKDTQARVSARVTNGRISVDGLPVSKTEDSRRRLDGTLGNGGTATIRIETTNGSIHLRGR